MAHSNGGAHNKGKGAALAWLKTHVAYEGNECLIWPFHRNPLTGRGAVGVNGKVLKAHRVMCELVNGPAPTPEHHAAHLCGKGHDGCVHPHHVYWKTPSENQADRRAHGTMGCGRKLNKEKWRQIRALKGLKTQAEIAKMFGVSFQNVSYLHRKRVA